jgi:hypothetical protein
LKVKNTRLPYLNYSLGNAYLQIDSVKFAELYFRKEIENNGNVNAAYFNLLKLLAAYNRVSELEEYLKNPETKNYAPPTIAMAVYFTTFQPINYAAILFKTIFGGTNVWGTLAALLILCIWVFYLRQFCRQFLIFIFRHSIVFPAKYVVCRILKNE